MNKWIVFISLIFFMFGCDGEGHLTKSNEPERADNEKGNDYGLDKITLDPYIIEHYTRDAKQLYFHEIVQNSSHTDYDNPVLDEDEVTDILRIIQAVYNMDTHERDTVFDVYEIHGYYCYSFNSISLKVNTGLPEIQNLSNNIFPTRGTSLDNILNTYKFDSVQVSYSYPDFPWLTIFTKNEYNMVPIEKEFNKLSSVLIAEFSRGCIGDGNNITLERGSDSAVITFSIGYGDCPAGCIYHRYWEFRVSNGIAEFVKAY
ncbi:MAG: hypothetical protein LBV74_14735 [Tannerella sp.]|jgi:hypothetical protein|nr:hypothetical protein [Tannerella sp.]